MSATIEQRTASTTAPTAGGRRLGALAALLRTSTFRASWTAFWRSRLLIWAVGGLVFALYGANHDIRDLADPQHISSTLGSFGNALAAPAVRWDAIWYLHLAQHGYRSLQDSGFFPLYPLLIRLGSWPLGSTIVAGIAISLLATLIGLVIVHRLTQLELGPSAAASAVTLLAFAPFSFYLSAVYTEGLFLALTAGTFYAARRGRWGIAGLVGGLAAMTRVTGVLLVAPVLLLFFYGPREDASPRALDRPPGARTPWLRPRYGASANALCALLIPAGLVLFCAYTAARGFGFSAPFHAQEVYWQHQFRGPLAGIWDGIVSAWRELKARFAGNPTDLYRGPALLQLGVLVASATALVGVFRRLSPAYGAYVLLGLLIPLSTPTVGNPLNGLARYASMMFPLFMWAGAWISGRRLKPLLIGVSIFLQLWFTIQFVTWHIVGTIPEQTHDVTQGRALSLGSGTGARP